MEEEIIERIRAELKEQADRICDDLLPKVYTEGRKRGLEEGIKIGKLDTIIPRAK